MAGRDGRRRSTRGGGGKKGGGREEGVGLFRLSPLLILYRPRSDSVRSRYAARKQDDQSGSADTGQSGRYLGYLDQGRPGGEIVRLRS